MRLWGVADGIWKLEHLFETVGSGSNVDKRICSHCYLVTLCRYSSLIKSLLSAVLEEGVMIDPSSLTMPTNCASAAS